jgi:galactonate dehydratase
VRAYHSGWYREVVDVLPRVENGQVFPLEGPGLGLALKPEVFERADAVVRLSGERTAAEPSRT